LNAPFNGAQPAALALPPPEFEALLPPPLLLPGESLQKYQLMRHAIFEEIAPRTAIEWLLAIDVVELSWEIQRYRMLRHKLLEHYRQKAIEHGLRCIDLAGIPPEVQQIANHHIRQNAQTWRVDPKAASEIAGRLAAHGFDEHSVNMQVYLEAADLFLTFEGLLNSAQNRRLSLLREVDAGRYRSKNSSDASIKSTPPVPFRGRRLRG
jgi:hypothetical protein